MKKIRVVELFAGVGGFRIGLEGPPGKKIKGTPYKVIWSSQWEPGAKIQYASEIYKLKFKVKDKEHSNEDIQSVIDKDFKQIPQHDLLVGGFPCQDYSVARTLSQASGIIGKKGVLWWSIYGILKKMKKRKTAPDYLMLENVDRLLKSPAGQRGRDFAVMLASLNKLGYIVEWRVINAAEYGMPQRRRRVFIMGYKKDSKVYRLFKKIGDPSAWMHKVGVIAKAFPVEPGTKQLQGNKIGGKLDEISRDFSSDAPSKSPFENTGMMSDGLFYTTRTSPAYDGTHATLGQIIIRNEKEIPDEFFLDSSAAHMKKWKDLKGSKNEPRTSRDGFEYQYTEGSMAFPDPLDKPSRTIVTGEGGSTPSRFKHVIKTKNGKLRRLTPIELEKLNMFPPNHTKYMLNKQLVPNTRRAFLMGNALVVGIIEGLGKSLNNLAKQKC